MVYFQPNHPPRTCPLPAGCALLMSSNYGAENALDTGIASPPPMGVHSNSATARILESLPHESASEIGTPFYTKEDFFVRKYFCKAFGALRTEIPASGPFRRLYNGVNSFLMSTSECEELFKSLLVETDRLVSSIDPLHMGNIAKSLLFIAPRCLWCYRTEAHLDPLIPQIICCGLCGATYCSSEHKTKAETIHKATTTEDGQTECDILRLKLMSSHRVQEELLSWVPTMPGMLLNLPDCLSFLALTSDSYKSTPSLLRTILSTYLTIPLTILDALHRFEFPSIGDRLVIHILGAEEHFELKNEGKIFEEIVHQLPFLRELAIEFIGPEVGNQDADHGAAMVTCATCAALGKGVNHSKVKALYHDYASSALYTRPTLVVAFNSGLHQSTTSWIPTIQLLLDKNLPCVFTSNNLREATLDAKHLRIIGAKMNWMEEWNKWTGQKVENLEDSHCRFENAFWLGFQGNTKGHGEPREKQH